MSVEGTWNLKIQSPMGERTGTLQLTGALDLRGSVTTGEGSTDVIGQVSGESVAFKGTMQGPMGAIELAFTGTVNGDEIAGNVQFGSFGSGAWSATRA